MLRRFITALRAMGVTHYEGAGLTVQVDPHPPPSAGRVGFDPDPPKATEELDEESRIRKDGLTRAQQIDLYGRPME